MKRHLYCEFFRKNERAKMPTSAAQRGCSIFLVRPQRLRCVDAVGEDKKELHDTQTGFRIFLEGG